MKNGYWRNLVLLGLIVFIAVGLFVFVFQLTIWEASAGMALGMICGHLANEP